MSKILQPVDRASDPPEVRGLGVIEQHTLDLPGTHTPRPAPARTPKRRRPAGPLTVADVAGRATITVAEAAQLIGVGRSAAYEAARRGQLPTRRVGRKLLVPVPALLAWLGTDGNESGGPLGHHPDDSAARQT